MASSHAEMSQCAALRLHGNLRGTRQGLGERGAWSAIVSVMRRFQPSICPGESCSSGKRADRIALIPTVPSQSTLNHEPAWSTPRPCMRIAKQNCRAGEGSAVALCRYTIGRALPYDYARIILMPSLAICRRMPISSSAASRKTARSKSIIISRIIIGNSISNTAAQN